MPLKISLQCSAVRPVINGFEVITTSETLEVFLSLIYFYLFYLFLLVVVIVFQLIKNKMEVFLMNGLLK